MNYPISGRLLVLPFLALIVAGCASQLPKSIEAVDVVMADVRAVRDQPGAFVGKRVRWGGQIISVENLKDHSLVTVLARPLQSNGRPDNDRQSAGRFIAHLSGFVDPAEYAKDAQLTVLGRVTGAVKKPVGEYPYLYPQVGVEGHYLWPPLPEREVIYYDPYFDPWYRPWWHRYPYWRSLKDL